MDTDRTHEDRSHGAGAPVRYRLSCGHATDVWGQTDGLPAKTRCLRCSRWCPRPRPRTTVRGHLVQCSNALSSFATSFLLQGKIGITVIVGAIYWFLWNASTGRETDDRY